MANIQFADPQVVTILNNNGIGSNGQVTDSQAAAVTDIWTIFKDSTITSFDEFRYFTGVSALANAAFKNCTLLTSIVFPDSLRAIGEEAFANCSSINDIDIKAGILEIGANAFNYCSSLQTLKFQGGGILVIREYFDGHTFSPCYIFRGCPLKRIYIGRDIYVRPVEGTGSGYGYSPFWGNYINWHGIEKVIIGSSVTEIAHGDFASQYVKSLTFEKPRNTVFNLGYHSTAGQVEYTFQGILDKECIFFVQKDMVDSYKANKGWTRSGLATYVYPFMPVIKPPSSTFTLISGTSYSVTVDILNPSWDNATYYTVDGSEPTSGSTIFTETFNLILTADEPTKTVRATSELDGEWTYDTATYALAWPDPVISPSGQYFTNPITVTITCANPELDIYYTTDGTNPTSASTLYTQPFTITENTTVKAVAYKGTLYSNVVTEEYICDIVPELTTTIIPPSTTYIESDEVNVEVTISAVTNTGKEIHTFYTTDGTTPTSASTPYTSAFTVTVTDEINVKAYSYITFNGTTYTDTDEATYIVKYRTQQPTVLPQSGNYYEGFTLDITYPDGSDVYYTTDGTTPTSGSTKYTQQIYIDADTTFKAIAYDTDNDIPDSEVVQRDYTFSTPARSRKAPRNEDNFNGIYVKDVDYSGTTPSIIDEADVTWGYRIDNADENLGEYGTRCHVEDTSILIHIDFTHGGKDYSLDKEIPVTCIVQDAQYMADILDLIQGSAIVTLNNTLEVSIRAKVTHTSESQTSSIVDLSNFTLSGTSTNGNFTCSKEGSYFVYNDTLSYDYKGSTHPANDITLTLINNNTQQQLSTLVIPVTFAAGSIFDVKDDAIRMAVASSITYTDSGLTYVNNRITDVEINISGVTSTVSSITTNLSGVTYDVSQIEQRCDRIETNVTNISGDMVTHSEIIQVATAITANVYDELNERTGIDIYNGTITLDADYTYITGNLMLSGATDGISFSDASGNTKISLSTELLPNLEQFDMGTITRKRGGVTQQIDTIQQSITTNFTDVPLGQYSQGQTIQIDYIVFTAHFSDAPFDERLDTMTYIIAIKQNSTVIGTHSGSCTRVYEFMDEFTTGSMSTTATGTGDVTIDMSITCTNKSTAEPKTGRWQTSYNMLYQKVEVAQTTIRLNGLATFQDTTHYAWLGPDQTAFRQGESTLRLKNGRIERTPIRAEGGMTSSNFADVSTVVPFRIVNGLTHSASTQNDGLIIFSTVLGETDSAQRTLYLGDPSECQGKILYVKNIVGANTKVKISSDVYRQDLLMPCNSVSEVTEISIGAYSSMFISDGFDWIQFHCA